MQRYTGPLSEDLSNRIKQYERAIELVLERDNELQGLGAAESDVINLEESIERFNAGISTNEIKAWVYYRQQIGIPMTGWDAYYLKNEEKEVSDLIRAGALFFGKEGNLEPYPIFVYGNVYDKLAIVRRQEDRIKFYGQEVFNNHIRVLEAVQPKKLSFTNTEKSERPRIKAISKLAGEFEVEQLKDSAGVFLEGKTTLVEAYKDWLRNKDPNDIKPSSATNIIRYYIEGQPKPQEFDPGEWQKVKANARDRGEELFQDFLHEALIIEDQQRLDYEWNYNFNAIAAVQHHKIPIGVEVSRYFHGFNFDLREAQREGVAYMELVRSGILAYDVGVGKTITAIVELANAMRNGKAKRPLVVVPNPTYENWKRELFGFQEDGQKYDGILSGTGYGFNDWFNLGTGVSADLESEVPENTITLMSYEGFMKLGFGDQVESELLNELSNILDQGKTNASEKELEKQNESYRELIGVGQQGAIADVDLLGFDYVCIDEAHNFKNVFSKVKKDDDEKKKRFELTGGAPSNRAIKAFFILQYVQRTYGRNTMLLTATPFTNSPIEVYSMLSLVAQQQLKEINLYNLNDFMMQFIQETTDFAVKPSGEIAAQSVVKAFENRIILQKIIHNHINFKTADEANIPRPCKVNLPRTTRQTEDGKVEKLPADKQILTYIRMTEDQEENQTAVARAAEEGPTKEDPGKVLRALNASLNNALSPYLYRNETPEDYKTFVENSPKIQYAVECVRSVRDYHLRNNEPVSGQVIYMDRGKEYMSYIKEYLEKEVGFKKKVKYGNKKIDEVEIIQSGSSTEFKEKAKNAFNDNVCKVVIGTSTIKEGINLQVYGTTLYNLYVNWNPTDVKQLEGRVWRQKNKYGYVRLVIPLVENSMDVFMFQKLEEKSARINDLWSKAERGNVLDEESLDPDEIKYALISDYNVLVNFEINQEQESLQMEIDQKQKQNEDFISFEFYKKNYNFLRTRVLDKLNAYPQEIINNAVFTDRDFNRYKLADMAGVADEETFTKKELDRYEKISDFYNRLQAFLSQPEYDDAGIIRLSSEATRKLRGGFDKETSDFKDVSKQYQQIVRKLLEPRGYSADDDLEELSKQLETELDRLKDRQKYLKSTEHREKVRESIRKRKEEMAVTGKDAMDRVKEFSQLNHLLSYSFAQVDQTSCEIPQKNAQKVSQSLSSKTVKQEQPAQDKEREKKKKKKKANAQKQRLRLLELETA